MSVYSAISCVISCECFSVMRNGMLCDVDCSDVKCLCCIESAVVQSGVVKNRVCVKGWHERL